MVSLAIMADCGICNIVQVFWSALSNICDYSFCSQIEGEDVVGLSKEECSRASRDDLKFTLVLTSRLNSGRRVCLFNIALHLILHQQYMQHMGSDRPQLIIGKSAMATNDTQ